MSRLLLVRHGQAAFGASDYDQLSDLGALQAQALGRHLAERGLVIDRIVSGTSRRHRRTVAELLAGAADAACAPSFAPSGFLSTDEPAIDPRLDEFTAGLALMDDVLAEGADAGRDELVRRYLDRLERWSRGEIDVPGHEAPHEFFERVASAMDALCAQGEHGRTVLVVTSAGVIGAACTRLLDGGPTTWGRLVRVVQNTSLSEVLWSGERRSLSMFNSTAHLSPELHTWI